jgi:CheY-like chemotaxis protein
MAEVTARILIVEDEDEIAQLIKIILVNHGLVVNAIVSSGEEAVETALATHPDLVLMDIKLGGKMDGIAAAEEIRKSVDIPILFISAYSHTIGRAITTKPSGYLKKPFTREGLIRKVEMALSGYVIHP